MTRSRADITPEVLRELIDADFSTGVLKWRRRGPEWYSEVRGGKGMALLSAERQAQAFNTAWEGKLALNRLDNNGYLGGTFFQTTVKAHRVIWAIAHGRFPAGFVDHINGVRNDNRIENLREVTPRQNTMNSRAARNSTSAFLGVSWNKNARKWIAVIGVDRRQKYLGLFDDERDAALAYNAAAQKYFGEYANLNRLADLPNLRQASGNRP